MLKIKYSPEEEAKELRKVKTKEEIAEKGEGSASLGNYLSVRVIKKGKDAKHLVLVETSTGFAYLPISSKQPPSKQKKSGKSKNQTKKSTRQEQQAELVF